MSNTLTQKIQTDFDRIAQLEQAKWEHNNHYHSFLLKQLPARCERVLEIGCGTGSFTRLLAERANQVTAIDLSPKMIEVAQSQSQQYANIEFQVADVMQWEFPVEAFDAIVSITTVHHLSLEHLLPKIKTALKKDGKLLILDLCQSGGLQDIPLDGISIPLNWIWQIVKNQGVRPSQAAIEAWQEHGRTDRYLTWFQAQQIYQQWLPGAKVRKHLFWRYSAVWQK